MTQFDFAFNFGCFLPPGREKGTPREGMRAPQRASHLRKKQALLFPIPQRSWPTEATPPRSARENVRHALKPFDCWKDGTSSNESQHKDAKIVSTLSNKRQIGLKPRGNWLCQDNWESELRGEEITAEINQGLCYCCTRLHPYSTGPTYLT